MGSTEVPTIRRALLADDDEAAQNMIATLEYK